MSAYKKTQTKTKRKTTSSQKSGTKRKTSAKKRRSAPKVYIPAYKTIILCISVIIICLLLLLITTLPKKTEEPQISSIAERFENEELTPEDKKLSSPDIKLEDKKTEIPEVEKAKPQTKTEEKKQTQEKKTDGKKSEEKKSDVKKPEEKTVAVVKPEAQKKTEEKPAPAPEKSFGFESAKNNAQLIFVFDDGGQNLEHLKKFLALPFPITVAVLPQITHSKEAADMVRKSGNEVILHQPMQSVNAKINPGPGAITPDMTEEEIKNQLFTNINQLGPIAGMNNHEGSGITADIEKMEIILKEAEQSGLYFLDSRTNVETKVPYVAKGLGYTYYERNIFLDNEKTRANALAEIKKGLALANKNGSVIMIGHIWSADFLPDLLTEIFPELVLKGYTFSVVSKSNAQKR